MAIPPIGKSGASALTSNMWPQDCPVRPKKNTSASFCMLWAIVRMVFLPPSQLMKRQCHSLISRENWITTFGTRKDVVIERARFNKRVQGQSETIHSFIQDLYKIAEGCSYGVLKKELIRQNCGGGCQRQSLRAPPELSQPQATRGHAAE